VTVIIHTAIFSAVTCVALHIDTDAPEEHTTYISIAGHFTKVGILKTLHVSLDVIYFYPQHINIIKIN
jgi:hypothetical protein